MTNKTATFTFTNTPSGPLISPQVTFGADPVGSEAAKKATTLMTKVFKAMLPSLQNGTTEHQANYSKLMASKSFTASLVKMPNDKEKDGVRFFDGGSVDITQAISKETSQKLINALPSVASPTKTSATPSVNHQQNLSLQSPTNFASLTNVASSTKTSTTLTPTASNLQVSKSPTKTSSNPTNRLTSTQIETPKQPTSTDKDTPTHNIVYRFFAAIINFFFGWMWSDTSYPPLLPKEKPDDLTSAPTNQSKTAESSKSVSKPQSETVTSGIRPLANGNNICFINAVFQALINMLNTPELRKVLIDAHEAKIQRENQTIANLELAIAIDESTYLLPWSNSPSRVLLNQLEASREASITLNQALRSYNDETKSTVWLKPLRGFDPSFSGWSQQDARELLDKIFDPLLEPLRNGLNQNGKPSPDIIPDNINDDLKTSLNRFVPKFGARRQWVLEGDTADNAINTKEVKIASTIPFEVPPFVPNERTNLQDLVTAQLQLQKPPVAYTYEGEINKVKGKYQAFQESPVIESLADNAPEYVNLQLMRFDHDQSKNLSAIFLPENNRITLIVDGQKVDYEIQTLVMHDGTRNSGHYFSYVRENGAWVIANDNQKPVQFAELPASAEEQVYMVFLKKAPINLLV